MSTRTIVTSQPDVACDVCERRLLRGEHADAFVVAGRRRLVCELCAPRAVHQGWMRESDQQLVSLPPMRPRRGRSLFERLRMLAWPGEGRERDASADQPPAVAGPETFDFVGAAGDASGIALTSSAREHAGAAGATPAGAAAAGEASDPADVGAARPSEPELAVELFNTSEHPRRVAGVARSLGAPVVSVRSAEHAASVVRIVVAWELCWYRYEIDLDELDAGVRVAAQGSELGELTREERESNATARESGLLALSGA
jgi:hypothetical protein